MFYYCWCIRKPWYSFIMLYNNIIIAHNHHTNNNPYLTSLHLYIYKNTIIKVPDYPSFKGSKQSLSIWKIRHKMLDDYVNPLYNAIWKSMESRQKNKRIKKLFSYTFLNPRLPIEMRSMLKGETRRRTIADPERLAAQMVSMVSFERLYLYIPISLYLNISISLYLYISISIYNHCYLLSYFL